jgi:type I restriction-modification system DNA methylase subunit
VRGQERNPDTWRLAKMNLAIRGIAHKLGDAPESTFAEDLHKDEKVDFIMANPPLISNSMPKGLRKTNSTATPVGTATPRRRCPTPTMPGFCTCFQSWT